MAYTYGGARATNDFYVDSLNKIYYDKFSVTISPLIITNAETDERLDTALSNIKADITSLNATLATKANLQSPVFTGTPNTTTPDIGDSSTRIANTEYVQNAINNYNPFPSQAEHAGSILYTNGTEVSWANLPGIITKKYNVDNDTTTEFTLNEEEWVTGTTLTELLVYRNGILLSETDDYTCDSVNRKITLINPAIKGDIIQLKLTFNGMLPSVNGSGSGTSIASNVVAVSELPANPDSNTFYFVKVSEGTDPTYD